MIMAPLLAPSSKKYAASSATAEQSVRPRRLRCEAARTSMSTLLLSEIVSAVRFPELIAFAYDGELPAVADGPHRGHGRSRDDRSGVRRLRPGRLSASCVMCKKTQNAIWIYA